MFKEVAVGVDIDLLGCDELCHECNVVTEVVSPLIVSTIPGVHEDLHEQTSTHWAF